MPRLSKTNSGRWKPFSAGTEKQHKTKKQWVIPDSIRISRGKIYSSGFTVILQLTLRQDLRLWAESQLSGWVTYTVPGPDTAFWTSGGQCDRREVIYVSSDEVAAGRDREEVKQRQNSKIKIKQTVHIIRSLSQRWRWWLNLSLPGRRENLNLEDEPQTFLSRHLVFFLFNLLFKHISWLKLWDPWGYHILTHTYTHSSITDLIPLSILLILQI